MALSTKNLCEQGKVTTVTLHIEKYEDESRQLIATVTVQDDRLQKGMIKLAKKLARDWKIPGFRPGKAPYTLIKQMAGEENLQIDAFQEIYPELYRDVLTQLDVIPHGRSSLDDVVSYEPLVVKFTIPLEPVVVLSSEYRSWRQEIEPITVSDAAIDEKIEAARQRELKMVELDRPTVEGDSVVITGAITIDGESEPFVEYTDEQTFVSADDYWADAFLGLIDLRPGESKQFSYTVLESTAEEDEDGDRPLDISGKTLHFDITVNKILDQQLPEIDEAFLAKQKGSPATLEDWREQLSEEMHDELENEQRQKRLDDFAKEMIENVEELAYAPGLVMAELDTHIENLQQRVKRANLEWEDYLAYNDLTEEEVREDAEPHIINAIESRLVIQQFARNEQLWVTPEEEEAEVEKRINTNEVDPDMFQRLKSFWLSEQGGLNLIRETLFMEKLNQRILDIYAGNAPELSAEATSKAEATSETEPTTETK